MISANGNSGDSTGLSKMSSLEPSDIDDEPMTSPKTSVAMSISLSSNTQVQQQQQASSVAAATVEQPLNQQNNGLNNKAEVVKQHTDASFLRIMLVEKTNPHRIKLVVKGGHQT